MLPLSHLFLVYLLALDDGLHLLRGQVVVLEQVFSQISKFLLPRLQQGGDPVGALVKNILDYFIDYVVIVLACFVLRSARNVACFVVFTEHSELLDSPIG